MTLSIVSTLYKSSPYISDFHQRTSAAARKLVGENYEIILVNDGSPDNSLELAIQLANLDSHVIVVDLSKNFGHHPAMMAGLMQSKGQHVFLIDSDLEEDPEYLLDFSKKMQLESCDVVYGVQEFRKGTFFERWSGEIYYSIFNFLSRINHPRNVLTARLMTRRYVNALLQFREREMVISCLWIITGFKQCSHTVKKHASSASTYSFSKKVEHLINAVTSFSEAPLKLIFYTGLLILAGAIIYAILLIFNKLFLSTPMDGWTSVMVSIWLLGGMIISFVGIIGIYLAKIFTETKQRPTIIIRDIYGKSSIN